MFSRNSNEQDYGSRWRHLSAVTEYKSEPIGDTEFQSHLNVEQKQCDQKKITK